MLTECFGDARLRPGGAVLDPLREIRNFLGRELLFRRHFEVDVRVVNRANEKTLLRMARYHGRTRVAAGQHAVAVVQAQTPAAIGVGRVAVEAVVDEYG